MLRSKPMSPDPWRSLSAKRRSQLPGQPEVGPVPEGRAWRRGPQAGSSPTRKPAARKSTDYIALQWELDRTIVPMPNGDIEATVAGECSRPYKHTNKPTGRSAERSVLMKDTSATPTSAFTLTRPQPDPSR
jgi:hypothetical protein